LTVHKTCFVIMPFSKTSEEHTEDHWTRHFESFLKPLIEENPALKASRSQPLRGDILRQIITDLVVSDVVVADLTDSNPNVYWELGIRQSFKHGTVTVADANTRLPFDLGVKGTLFYNPKEYVQMEEFRRRFKEAVEDCLSHPDRPDSHVLETISGRGTLFEFFRRDEAIRRLDGLLSECHRNLQYLKKIHEQSKENLKPTEEKKFLTDRLGLSCVELLVTNRYVDEDQSFFGLAEKCLDWAISVNAQLALWEATPNQTDKWFSQELERPMRFFQELETRVKGDRDNVGKQV
jgi:hypothetical protein